MVAIYFGGNDCNGDGDVHYFFPFSVRGDNFLVGAIIGVVPFRVLLIECIGLDFINLMEMKASSREGGLTQVLGLSHKSHFPNHCIYLYGFN